jgi:hypothetical protein
VRAVLPHGRLLRDVRRRRGRDGSASSGSPQRATQGRPARGRAPPPEGQLPPPRHRRGLPRRRLRPDPGPEGRQGRRRAGGDAVVTPGTLVDEACWATSDQRRRGGHRATGRATRRRRRPVDRAIRALRRPGADGLATSGSPPRGARGSDRRGGAEPPANRRERAVEARRAPAHRAGRVAVPPRRGAERAVRAVRRRERSRASGSRRRRPGDPGRRRGGRVPPETQSVVAASRRRRAANGPRAGASSRARDARSRTSARRFASWRGCLPSRRGEPAGARGRPHDPRRGTGGERPRRLAARDLHWPVCPRGGPPAVAPRWASGCSASGSAARWATGSSARQAAVAALVEDRGRRRTGRRRWTTARPRADRGARLPGARDAARPRRPRRRAGARCPRCRRGSTATPALRPLAERSRSLADDAGGSPERRSRRLRRRGPRHLRQGGLIRDGVDAELDEARGAAARRRRVARRVPGAPQRRARPPQPQGRVQQGLRVLHRAARRPGPGAPDAFSRKQTLKNAERYITPELKDVRGEGDHRRGPRPRARAGDLRGAAADAARASTRSAPSPTRVAELDVLRASPRRPHRGAGCRPEITDEPILDIAGGRHPVLDELLGSGSSPTTCASGRAPSRAGLALITGPNMAGKSTYIRQTRCSSCSPSAGSYIPRTARPSARATASSPASAPTTRCTAGSPPSWSR